MYVDLMRPASKSSPEDSRSWTLESGLGSGSLYLSSVLLQVNVTSLTTHVFSFPFVACMLHSGTSQTQRLQRPLANVFDPSIYWQGVCKHLVDNAPSVGIVRCSKNAVDAREKNIQQRAKSLSLAGALAANRFLVDWSQQQHTTQTQFRINTAWTIYCEHG